MIYQIKLIKYLIFSSFIIILIKYYNYEWIIRFHILFWFIFVQIIITIKINFTLIFKNFPLNYLYVLLFLSLLIIILLNYWNFTFYNFFQFQFLKKYLKYFFYFFLL